MRAGLAVLAGAALLAAATAAGAGTRGDYAPDDPLPPIRVPSTPTTEHPETPLVDLRLPSVGLRASQTGVVKVTLTNANGRMTLGRMLLISSGKVRIGRGEPKLLEFGSQDFIIRGGARRKLSFELSPANRELLAQRRRIDVTVSFEARDRLGRQGGGGAGTRLLAPRR